MQTTATAYAKLRLSNSNVRKTNRGTGLAALAASIAEYGLLQPLIVSPAKGKKTLFDVHAGGRRWPRAPMPIKGIAAILSSTE